MKYTVEELLTCLKLRRDWYQRAIDLIASKETVSDFDFPAGTVKTWIGARKELQNTIDMMEAK